MKTARLSDDGFTLLARTLGSPRETVQRLARFVSLLARYGDRAALDAKLAKLERNGWIDRIPNGVQLAVGSIDMMRFWIAPASADYYDRIGIDFAFHQILRVIEEPASLADPVGLFSERDGIIGHLMQIVHANPVYDLQLLSLFDDGLDALESQLEAMMAGTHPRARAIGAIVEEADYHARLLAYVRAWRADPDTPPLLRENVEQSAYWRSLERTFGSLPGAMRYFDSLPTTVAGAVKHLATQKSFTG